MDQASHRGLLRARLRSIRPGETHRSQRLHLGLQLDAKALDHTTATLLHQRDHVGRCGSARVLYEVGVLGRKARAPDSQAVAFGLGQQQPGAASLGRRIFLRVLESGAETS